MFRVLLVCTGNICRSPMAHGLLADRSTRDLDGLIEVRSAGTWARRGSRASGDSVAAAAELGVDIAGHRSTPFSSELGASADLVVTMTGEQREEVLAELPDAASRTFTLKELVAILDSLPPVASSPTRESLQARVAEADEARRAGRARAPVDEDVVDPLGLSQLTYRAVAKEIEDLIDGMLRGLVGVPARAGDA